MNKRKIRVVNIRDMGDAKPYNRMFRIKKQDEGVVFRFEIPEFNDEFVSYVQDIMQRMKEQDVKNYTISLVTHNPDSPQSFVRSATRIISTQELETLIDLEGLLPDGAKLVVTEKYHDKFMDFSVSEAIQAHEFVNQNVEYIKSLNLSPFEEYLMAYDLTALFFYNDDNDANEKDYFKSRLLTSALTDEYFVCSAHSKLLVGLLQRLHLFMEHLNLSQVHFAIVPVHVYSCLLV